MSGSLKQALVLAKSVHSALLDAVETMEEGGRPRIRELAAAAAESATVMRYLESMSEPRRRTRRPKR